MCLVVVGKMLITKRSPANRLKCDAQLQKNLLHNTVVNFFLYLLL